MLITKDASSFIVLGEAVCGLSEDELLAEGISRGEGKVGGCTHCGECRRQCPADAADDKSRCISSITQKKGELSESEKDIIRKTGMVWGWRCLRPRLPRNENCDEKRHSRDRHPVFHRRTARHGR